MSSANPFTQTDAGDGIEVEVFPFMRMPILDRDAELVAYDLCHQANDGASLADATLRLFNHSALPYLTGKHTSFLEVDADLLRGQAEHLAFNTNLGPRVLAELALADDIFDTIRGMAGRGVPIMLDNLVWPVDASVATADRLRELVKLSRLVSIDIRRHNESSMVRALGCLRAADHDVVATATFLYERRTQRVCLNLGFDAFEGTYLFKPADEQRVDHLKPNRVNLLRLLAAVQDPENGPIELEELIRNDAVLSYKLLNCVNSAYFGLPRELKSLQQAAVYFGTTRIRNWVYSLAIGDLDDAPPELLKQALLRARMAELAGGGLPPDQRDMAFMAGLFSLLDTLMGAPMERILEDVPVPDPVRAALVDGRGPLGYLLGRIRAWEHGEAGASGSVHAGGVPLSEAYLRALEWAEHVYSFAQREAA